MVRDLLEAGLRHHQSGRLNEAKALYEQALTLEPRNPDALHLSGVVALQMGVPQRAIAQIQQAIGIQPDNPGFHGNLAQALLAVKRFPEARAAFQRAVALAPGEPQFAVGAANASAMQGELADAESELRQVTRRHPRYALAWFNLGNVVQEQERHREAVELFSRAIALEPALADAHNNLGRALHRLARLEEAEQEYRRCLALAPDSLTGNCNLASVLMDRGRFADASEVCRQALRRQSASPELHILLGTACTHQGQIDAALQAFRAGVEAAPEDPRAQWAYGYALLRSGSEKEGLARLQRVVALQPDSAEYHSALATIYLSLGNLEAGWREHDWRSARSRFLADHPSGRALQAFPGTMSGARVCVLREQGLGDELFFLRFAAGLKERGAEITYCAHPKIAGMLGRVPVLDRVIAAGDPLPASDIVVLAGDLPRALGAADFPPPLALAPLPRELDIMTRRLAALGPPPYLGVTWRAGTPPERQAGTEWQLHKNVPLEALGAALREAQGTLIAVQRHPAGGEIERLAALAGKTVVDLTAINEDLEAMLALMALLDDYIGASNTNMHLRAGTGRVARVLVPQPPEWRWMAQGDDSPWFPGFRVYRQNIRGDWRDALGRLSSDLRARGHNTR
jgi:tetratricopeptide (TPR) repeat protein